MRPSDALYILGRSVPQTKLGRDVSLTFMKANWSRLTQEFSDALFAVNAYIAGVLSNFADVDTLKEVSIILLEFLLTEQRRSGVYSVAVRKMKC